MAFSTARDIATRHLTEDGPHEVVEFDFIGGEPLYAWDRIVALIEYVHQHRWSRNCSFSFTTNGTLFTDEIKAWLDRHSCIAFSFSIDGTRAAHDLNRGGSYRRMIAHVPWAFERCARLKIEPRVKMTISPDTVPMMAQGIAELHDMGFAKIDANIPYENIWDDRLESSLATFAEQLDVLVDYYVRRPELDPPLLVDMPLMNVVRKKDGDHFPRWCGAGDPMICYDVEGRALPCHRFVPISTGRTYEGPLTFEPKTWDDVRKADDIQCAECPFISLCPSCMALNWLENGDVDRRTRWHCPFTLLQIKASAKLTILRAAKGTARAPSQDALDNALRVHELLSGTALYDTPRRGV